MLTPPQSDLAGEACERCDDSGFVETVCGGFWNGIGPRTLSFCRCACGNDARRQWAARAFLSAQSRTTGEKM